MIWSASSPLNRSTTSRNYFPCKRLRVGLWKPSEGEWFTWGVSAILPSGRGLRCVLIVREKMSGRAHVLCLGAHCTALTPARRRWCRAVVHRTSEPWLPYISMTLKSENNSLELRQLASPSFPSATVHCMCCCCSFVAWLQDLFSLSFSLSHC